MFAEALEAPVSAMVAMEQALGDAGNGLTPIDRLVGMRMVLQSFCAIMRSLVTVSPALFRALSPGIARFLSHDFISIIDEEKNGLLHHLNRRLLVGDELDQLIAHLHEEHSQDRLQALSLSRRCEEYAAGANDDWPDLCEALAGFAEQQRRHLVWEDATILPIARERLQPEDMVCWDADMRRRYRMVT